MDESQLERLSPQALRLLESAAVATVVTLDADNAPHVSAAWVGVEDGEVVIGTLDDQRKLRNLRRDPRIALTLQSDRINQWGLREYLVLYGTARITEGGRRSCCSGWRTRTSARTQYFRPCPILPLGS